MIANERELAVTQQRIGEFQRILAQLRVTARPQEFPMIAGGYRAEIERMQREVLEYLTRHVSAVAVES